MWNVNLWWIWHFLMFLRCLKCKLTKIWEKLIWKACFIMMSSLQYTKTWINFHFNHILVYFNVKSSSYTQFGVLDHAFQCFSFSYEKKCKYKYKQKDKILFLSHFSKRFTRIWSTLHNSMKDKNPPNLLSFSTYVYKRTHAKRFPPQIHTHTYTDLSPIGKSSHTNTKNVNFSIHVQIDVWHILLKLLHRHKDTRWIPCDFPFYNNIYDGIKKI